MIERVLPLVTENSMDRVAVFNNYACALNDLGRHEEALRIVQKELDRRPATKDRWWLIATLAEIYRDSGAREQGLAIARQLCVELESEPKHGPARLALAATRSLFAELEAAP